MLFGVLSPVFGKNIRYLRGLCRMSQSTLALLVGISVYYIRKIENTKAMISIDYRAYFRCCAVFGVEEDGLFRRDLQEEGFALPVYTHPYRGSVEEYFYDEE